MNEHSSDSINKIEQASCICTSSKGLFIPNRHMSLLVAAIIVMLTTTFLVGYFWGKRTALHDLIEKVSHDSFADQIYTSVCSLYDQIPETPTQEQAQITAEVQQTGQASEAEQQPPIVTKKYYAQLVGFGDYKNAEQFVARAKHKGFNSFEIEKKISKTTKGKTITWYQIVTAPTAQYDDLKNTVDRISKEERLKGAQILSC